MEGRLSNGHRSIQLRYSLEVMAAARVLSESDPAVPTIFRKGGWPDWVAGRSGGQEFLTHCGFDKVKGFFSKSPINRRHAPITCDILQELSRNSCEIHVMMNENGLN